MMSLPEIKLRPHHICCTPYTTMDFAERDPDFQKLVDRTKNLLLTSQEQPVVISENPDGLCYKCPHYKDGACTSSDGQEAEVRKWDAILLRELGVPFDTRLTAAEWKELVRRKSPFRLCQRCRWARYCTIAKPRPA
ncbi:MAG: DUF1284 domain-containing protein [Chloroflexi bacterium]|nr:DUF1284 domain-containing protein [Chloroflexota bacterium]